MANINKISSFKSFSEVKSQESTVKLREANNTKRQETVNKLASILDEMGLTSLEGLEEVQRNGIIDKMFASGSLEKVDPPTPPREKLKEGNAFGDAVRKAKEAGETEFEFDGKTYKVEESIFNEALKDDYTAKYNTTEITLKNGYTQLKSTALNNMYNKVGELIKEYDVNVKSVIFNFDRNALSESTVLLDTTDPDDKTLQKFIKKNNIKMKDTGVGGDFGEYEYTGKRKDLEKMISDLWGDDYLIGFIEESIANEGFEKSAIQTALSESTVLLDTTDPDDKTLQKFIKKNNIKMKDTGVGGDFGEYEYTGKRKDLEKMISDLWGDDYLIGFIEESIANEGFEKSAIQTALKANGYDLKQSDVKLGQKKKSGGYVQYTLNGEVIGSNDYSMDKLIAIATEKIKENPKKFKLEELKEGNAFGDAVRKAKEAGDDEFDFEGKTFKVEESIKESFYRLPKKVISNDLYVLDNRMQQLTSAVNNGSDLDIKALDNIISMLQDVRKSAKKFDKKEDLLGTVYESLVNEADIKSDDEFKDYAVNLLKKAFGDEFDEDKSQEVIDGILQKSDGDYGAAVGMLTSSLG
jgi:hypothetical protein